MKRETMLKRLNDIEYLAKNNHVDQAVDIMLNTNTSNTYICLCLSGLQFATKKEMIYYMRNQLSGMKTNKIRVQLDDLKILLDSKRKYFLNIGDVIHPVHKDLVLECVKMAKKYINYKC